jgi:fluoroacetyl-CoA thioesterase
MEIGATGEAAFVVTVGDTARALALTPGDDFPEVLATARMIALMELAASRAMKVVLRPGELSVGVGLDVKHLAATPPGVEARAVATFLGMDGKLYRFDVKAFDRGGLIGEGAHTRAVVTTERLLRGAASRNGGPASS